MWADILIDLFDRDMANFLLGCACLGASLGFFELVSRFKSKPDRRSGSRSESAGASHAFINKNVVGPCADAQLKFLMNRQRHNVLSQHRLEHKALAQTRP